MDDDKLPHCAIQQNWPPMSEMGLGRVINWPERLESPPHPPPLRGGDLSPQAGRKRGEVSHKTSGLMTFSTMGAPSITLSTFFTACTAAMTHQGLEHLDEQLGTHPALVSRKPKASSGIDCRSRRDGLSLAWHGNNRTLASRTPRGPMHCISTESGFVPEIDFRTTAFCPFCNGWIDVAFPSFPRSSDRYVSRRRCEVRIGTALPGVQIEQ